MPFKEVGASGVEEEVEHEAAEGVALTRKESVVRSNERRRRCLDIIFGSKG